ncbi:MAG: glycosyltransferase family 4 protein [Sedimentisphaerales bacterium]|nr:glycosyltransferase family 4 protein [Sedimentisphaerales bacterium]
MRILIIDHSGKSGMYSYTDALCNGLCKIGEDVTVLTSTAWPDCKRPYKVERLFSELNREQGSFTRLHWAMDRLLRSMTNISRRNKYALANEFDIVHIMGAGLPLLDQYFLKPLAKKKPVVLTVHDVMSHYERFVSKDSFMRKNLKIPHRLIVHFEKAKEILIQQWKIDSDKIDVIPHGIIPVQNKYALSEARQKLELPGNKKILLFFGSIRPNKGLDVLLKSMQEAVKNNPDILLVIAGALPRDMSFQPYHDLIEKMNLNEYVKTFIEFIPDEKVDLFFAASDLVVLPYKNFESQSGVLLRAYAHKKTVVVSDVGAMGEIVGEDKIGEIVEPGNEKSLALAINEALEKLDVYQSRYNTELENKYNWEQIGKLTLQYYEKAISQKK